MQKRSFVFFQLLTFSFTVNNTVTSERLVNPASNIAQFACMLPFELDEKKAMLL